ncbi:hypothetical protein C819_02372 [Lachnospiraceae bacterium 10-1]|nr:hypothetical protein C819_02372 [Lachnospiraceae bacterium 10-1]
MNYVWIRKRKPARPRTMDSVYFRDGAHHRRQRLPNPAGRAVLPRSLVGAAHYCGDDSRGSHWLAYLEKPAWRQVVKEAAL